MISFDSELFELVRRWTERGANPREMIASLMEQKRRLENAVPPHGSASAPSDIGKQGS